MPPLLSFLIEASMVQSGAIFFAALVVGYVTGPFLKNIGLNTYLRIALYSLVGAAAGIWSYSNYDIPDRSIELMELIYLSMSMLVYSLLIISPIVLFKNRVKQA
jgi:hypothetical protein